MKILGKFFSHCVGGITWSQLSSTANSDFYYVTKIAISDGNSNVIYASTRRGLYKATDGSTFTSILVYVICFYFF